MKKSVASLLLIVILLLFLAATSKHNPLTGFQALELPAPPPVPGMESEQLLPPVNVSPPAANVSLQVVHAAPKPEDIQSILARLDAVEQKLNGTDAWAQRLSTVEAQLKIASDMSARIDTVQSQIDGMKVDIDNLKKPAVEMPAFIDHFQSAITNLQGSLTKNAILSITLSVLALIIISGMIAAGIVQKKRTELEDKKLVRQYLMNYTNAGYKVETLRMHLRANGWDEKFIDERIREIPK